MEGQPVVDERPANSLLWPWQDENCSNLRFKPWLMTRGFTISFLSISWLTIIFLGFGSSWNCSESWQNEIICSSAIYANEIFTQPHEFIFSWFSAVWFTNGLDHIIYVTVGFLIFVQSYECRMGTGKTIFLFFSGTAVAATVVSIGINYGYAAFPLDEMFITGMSRNWMGGSVGMFAIMGALLHCSRRPLLLLIPIILFEIWNGQTNISFLTSSGHMVAITYGYVAGYFLQQNSVSGGASIVRG
ncbi:MAG: hypothetical protein QF817_04545 [Candidatus Poseidoniaceae archaeon]|nr:hypothetical protein [Candidatus Poseidoniaceae archaeon]